MTPVAKLVFGADYDKTRLTEFAAALSYGRRQAVPAGGFESFVERFEEKYGEKPTSSYIGNYYDAVTVFAEAYAKALEDDEDVTGEDVIAAVNEIVWRTQSDDTWVAFRGGLWIASMVFGVWQVFFITKHLIKDDEPPEPVSPGGEREGEERGEEVPIEEK